MRLDDAIEVLPGIGPKRAALLANLGIRTCRDLLFHLPRDYQDRRAIIPIAAAVKGEHATIRGEVVQTRMVPLRRRMSIAEVTLTDGTGEIKATWFGRGFLAKTFVPGALGVFTGVVGEYKGLALKNPDYEMLTGGDEDSIHTGRIVPIYPLAEKITQRMLRRWIFDALGSLEEAAEETLPAALLVRHGFPGLDDALREVHFPVSPDAARRARDRFAYEELLSIQLSVLHLRSRRLHEESGIRHAVEGPFLERFRAALPFALTAAQRQAVDDVLRDMESPRPMMRLIQGDVGCGKTAVALHAVAAAADGGYQTALMAPTEVLAEQHFATLRALLEPLGLVVELLTSSRKNAAQVRRRIGSGEARVVVGTQALVYDACRFHNLGLVVVDEQHRFGVVQRDVLAGKGANPDLLHMTATPIPRSLALTVYGAMDLTVIAEMPPGRMPVKTRRVSEGKVPDLYKYLCGQARQGVQTYYICPLVEESETRELASVITHFEDLSAGPLAELRTAVLHGRLPSEEKEQIMRAFKAGHVDVLFSTTVIEVGVDVPAANVMVIEDAAQFGLTQLHQLRGRVGRGGEQAYCFLLGQPKTKEGRRRLDVMCSTHSGFDIAEEDLTMRGPGEFYGVRQSGLTDLRVADLVRDVRLLDAARRDAQEILDDRYAGQYDAWCGLALAPGLLDGLRA